MRILRLSTLSLILTIAVVTLGASDNSWAGADVCKGKKSERPEACDTGPGSTPPYVPTHEAAIGRPLTSVDCDGSDASGDIFDVGTLHEDHSDSDGHTGNICELLQCAVVGGGFVDCGHNSAFNDEPQPLVDISGLLDNWGDDLTHQGDPNECFGTDGIINGIVSVANGRTGEVNIQIFFKDEVDTTVDHPKCLSASKEVNYSVAIGGCSLSSGSLPPNSAAAPAVIICASGTAWTVDHQGGGGTAAKCGCHATGLLGNETVILIQNIE